MKRRRYQILLLCGVLMGSLTACSLPVTRNTVQSFDVKTTRMDGAVAFNKVTGILVDRGFDIKTENKDAGVVTTEFKKFASQGDSPPFDYYLQIKMTIRQAPDGKTVVRMTPIVKEQNRLNAAAYTEHELEYYTGDPHNLAFIESMRPGGWRVQGQTIYMNVVSDVADAGGISVEDTEKNITTTTADALLVN